MNLVEGAALFLGMAHAFEKAKKDALEHACTIIEKEAKRVIGTYDYGWPALKESTIAHKSTGDSPLLETGEMRDSIEHKVVGSSGFVGSDDMKAVWQELGTVKIPPRSFLMGAAMNKGDEVAKALATDLFAILSTGALSGHWGSQPAAVLGGFKTKK